MLKLSFSLWLVAVLALFGLGALLDRIAETDQSRQPDLALVLLDQLAGQLTGKQSAELQEALTQLKLMSGLTLQLLPREQLALPASLQNKLQQPGGLALDEPARRVYYKALPNNTDLLLQMALPVEQSRPVDLWLTLSLYLGLGFLLLLWLLPLARRLLLLTKAAQAFGQGQLQTRVAESRWSYIPALERHFNQMASQIEQLLADNRLLASSLSHDLRTPIACLRFGLEAAQDADSAAQKDRYLQRMEADIERMEAMVNAFLEFASLDRLQQHWQLQQVDLNALCEQLQHYCQPLLKARQLTLHWQGLPPSSGQSVQAQSTTAAGAKTPQALLDAHPHWLERALQNLLQNASRYAQSRINLTLSEADDYWQLTLSDDGPGIAPADAARIFQPFVRLEATQSSEQPQFGLGLAIVRKVLDWHQGAILLTSFAPQGACFVIRLPKSTSHPQ